MLASLLLLALQDVAGKQLALGIDHVDELDADLEALLGPGLAMGDLATQQQAMGAWHQHHLYLHLGTRCKRPWLDALQTAFGHHHCLRLAYLAQQGMGDHGAEHVQALVLYPQKRCEGAVLVAELAQQVLGLEVGQVQLAEQIEQWGIILQHIWIKGLGRAQWADLKCDPIRNAVVFAAIFFV